MVWYSYTSWEYYFFLEKMLGTEMNFISREKKASCCSLYQWFHHYLSGLYFLGSIFSKPTFPLSATITTTFENQRIPFYPCLSESLWNVIIDNAYRQIAEVEILWTERYHAHFSTFQSVPFLIDHRTGKFINWIPAIFRLYRPGLGSLLVSDEFDHWPVLRRLQITGLTIPAVGNWN